MLITHGIAQPGFSQEHLLEDLKVQTGLHLYHQPPDPEK
ncbi:hypothetical protein SNOG_07216 [Parastagonospora nodorum SN15]|uniref:Uncharacterized protein n=1 Tax=Phaeosphaeria nodorum (strain SN15 / ATCC MYA-4574 / FGSC 10173) TaxID=321614 RepID=Q0ULZ8_PHANO|nr:hypothetical protein SNOG_07216 [Parastagonospora nodorum SN15]EAT85867.1 hypothetical protein SNOG_07216 [Parastagonospora nodorum SN15]